MKRERERDERQRETDLGVVLDEEEEDDIFPEVLDGQVQGEVAMGLEHVIQQGGTQLRKVTRVQVVLKN